MFHVKHTYFTRLKTLILSNTTCLEPSFTLQREPAQICSRSCTGSDRYDKLLALAIAPQILTKETRSRAGSMVIQQDNTRELLSLSTPSSIKFCRRLHRNTRAPNVSYHFDHTYHSHPYFYRQQIHSRKQNRQVHENAPLAFVGQPRKNHQNLDKHCLFVAVSRKTSPQIAHIDTSKPVGIAARSPTPNDKTYRAVQTRAFHSLSIIPTQFTRHAALHAVSRRFGHICPITRNTRQRQTLFTQCRIDAHTPQALYTSAHGHCRAANNAKHTFAAPPRRLCIALCYNFSLFVIAFLLFFVSSTILRPTEHIARPIPTPFCFYLHATRQARLSASGLPTDAYRYATPIFISHALREAYTQFRRKSPYTPAFAADTAARHPVLPLSTPSIPASGAGERISLRSRFMWNMRLVIHQNLNVYRGFCSFVHIYTLRYCMFSLMRSLLSAFLSIRFPLPLCGIRSRRGLRLSRGRLGCHSCRIACALLHFRLQSGGAYFLPLCFPAAQFLFPVSPLTVTPSVFCSIAFLAHLIF